VHIHTMRHVSKHSAVKSALCCLYSSCAHKHVSKHSAASHNVATPTSCCLYSSCAAELGSSPCTSTAELCLRALLPQVFDIGYTRKQANANMSMQCQCNAAAQDCRHSNVSSLAATPAVLWTHTQQY
jgi:hypothetical protein